MRFAWSRRLFQHGEGSGIALMLASALALILANSPFAAIYDLLLSVHASVRIGDYGIEKPLLLWINDGLMAIFFLLVGLEIKREVLEGELSNRKRAILPGAAAIGGMVSPALCDPVGNRYRVLPRGHGFARQSGAHRFEALSDCTRDQR